MINFFLWLHSNWQEIYIDFLKPSSMNEDLIWFFFNCKVNYGKVIIDIEDGIRTFCPKYK